jgi:alanine racemase
VSTDSRLSTEPLSFIRLKRQSLLSNIEAFRSILRPQTKLCAVVKANAYGHGLAEVASILDPFVDVFMVDDIEEFRALRRYSQKPAIVNGYVSGRHVAEICGQHGSMCVYDAPHLEEIASKAREQGIVAPVHLAVDALLGREGILPDQLLSTVQKINARPNLSLLSVYGHFANIEDTLDPSHARRQIDLFNSVVAHVRRLSPGIVSHISATSGILAYEQRRGSHELVRLGIGTYGMWPSEDLRRVHAQAMGKLQPCLTWVTHVAQVKTLPAQHPVGYGLSYLTNRPTRVALIPQGYSDGYDRGLSNLGQVLLKGQRCPVIGRVAMNMFIIDVSHLPEVWRGEEVVLLGQQGNEVISAEELAQRVGTINYEITTRISPLLPRVLI